MPSSFLTYSKAGRASRRTTAARSSSILVPRKYGWLFRGSRPDTPKSIFRRGALAASTSFAKPVGSCTDLVATVVQPLRDLYGDRFEVAPYPVLFKPGHGVKILRNEGGSGF